MKTHTRLALLAPVMVGVGFMFGCRDGDHHHVREHRVIVERRDDHHRGNDRWNRGHYDRDPHGHDRHDHDRDDHDRDHHDRH